MDQPQETDQIMYQVQVHDIEDTEVVKFKNRIPRLQEIKDMRYLVHAHLDKIPYRSLYRESGLAQILWIKDHISKVSRLREINFPAPRYWLRNPQIKGATLAPAFYCRLSDGGMYEFRADGSTFHRDGEGRLKWYFPEGRGFRDLCLETVPIAHGVYNPEEVCEDFRYFKDVRRLTEEQWEPLYKILRRDMDISYAMMQSEKGD